MCVEGCMAQVRSRLRDDGALENKNSDDNIDGNRDALLAASLSTSSSQKSQTQANPPEGSSRRNFLQVFARGLAAGSASAALAIGAFSTRSALAMDHEELTYKPVRKKRGPKRLLRRGIKRIVDLTHSFDSSFPTFGGSSGISSKQLASFSKDGYNAYRHNIFEHAGTHIDAPLHFSPDGASVDEIMVEQLVVPLVRLDFRAWATNAADADAQVTPDDLLAWEKKHGKIPKGACVAMDSGWDHFVGGEKFRNADEQGVMHFPGFHVDSASFLLEERDVAGVAVDTLSLDYGRSQDFAFHYAWLPRGKWGLECVANLSRLPAKGAVLVVGAPKWRGGSGGLTRVIALL